MELAEMENPKREMFACFAEAMLLELRIVIQISVGVGTILLWKRWILSASFSSTGFLLLVLKSNIQTLTV